MYLNFMMPGDSKRSELQAPTSKRLLQNAYARGAGVNGSYKLPLLAKLKVPELRQPLKLKPGTANLSQ
jgi:hypothetical protein